MAPAVSCDRPTSLRMSRYESVSAAIGSLIISFGILSSMLLLMWLQRNADAGASKPRLVPIPALTGQSADSVVYANDPGIEEFTESGALQLTSADEALTQLPANIIGLLTKFDSWGRGLPEGRDLTPPAPGVLEKRAVRWSIEYECEDQAEYLDQLTWMGIEIGFVSALSDRVELLLDLKTTPAIRTTTKAEERRMFFVHTNSKLQDWEMQLGIAAGIKPAGKKMVQFFPDEVTARLASIEAVEAGKRRIETARIQRTVFKVRAEGPGYEFFVVDVIAN